MIELPVHNRQGQVVGQMTIDPALFGGELRPAVMRYAVLMYEAAQRVGTHSTLDRSHVRGSRRKPWRQKGTGHARAGFRRSPIWRGGCVVFGPHPREYRYAMPRKALLAARKSAFLAKFQGGTTVVDELSVAAPRTKEVASALAALGIERTCLIAIAAPDAALWKSTRNIPRVTMKPISDVNAYDLLHTQRLLITRAALEKLLATLGASGEPAPAGAAKE